MKVMIVVLLMLGLGGYARYSGVSFSPAKAVAQPQAVAAVQPAQQNSGMTPADQQYLTTTMQNAGTHYRNWREGVTVQNLRLPSGKPMKMTITKTKTGWCPVRRENLYNMSVQVSE